MRSCENCYHFWKEKDIDPTTKKIHFDLNCRNFSRSIDNTIACEEWQEKPKKGGIKNG